MPSREKIRSDTEKYASELSKLLDDLGKELQKAAVRMEKVGEEVYDSLPREAKSFEKDIRNVVSTVISDMKEDIPKLQKNVESMGMRMEKYADDIQKSIRGKK